MHGSSLIIGCDSLIGSALFAYFKARDITVVGTTRRAGTTYPILNLEADLSTFKLPEYIEVAYLCAGITNSKTCARDPVGTRHINVYCTKKLIDKLLVQGCFVVFLSSDVASNPNSEYGSQKYAVEQYLEGKKATVVRLGKVLTAEAGLIKDWITELEKGRSIEPFEDHYFAPISMGQVLAVLGDQKLLKTHSRILLSAIEPMSYFQAIDFIAKNRHLDRSLIVPKFSCVKKVNSFIPDATLKEHCISAKDTLTELFGVSTPSYENS